MAIWQWRWKCVYTIVLLSLSFISNENHTQVWEWRPNWVKLGSSSGSNWSLYPAGTLLTMASVITCLSDFFSPTVSLIRSIARVQFGTRATQTRVSDWQQFFFVFVQLLSRIMNRDIFDGINLLQIVVKTLLKETMNAFLCIYSCSYSTLIQRLKAGSAI